MSKYNVITNNDGELTHQIIESNNKLTDVCRNAYDKLIQTYKDDDDEFILTDEWENTELESKPAFASMGATIDYEMGHEYRYDVSVKVEKIAG